MKARRTLHALLFLTGALPTAAQEDESRISDEVIPPRTDLVPDRPRPILELGDPFLGPGPLNRSISLPTGAELQPSILFFGTLRTAAQSFDDGNDTRGEWVSRADIFANVQFTGTERFLAGMRPLDESGEFTRYVWEPDSEDGWHDEFNGEFTTLFFEGDLGEMFPALDPSDAHPLDLGFSVGRQPISFQEGLLIEDRIDALGITRNTLLPSGTSNLRVTALFAWDEIGRDDNREDKDALLFGLFSEADLPETTLSFDAIYVDDSDGGDANGDSDALYFGAGAVQRIGHTNSSVRVLGSHTLHEESDAASKGVLLFGELSRNPTGSDDLVYATAFWGIDQFSSAARAPDVGGPLGRAGILFAAVGLGDYGAALGNRADDSFGGAVGWQTFLGDADHRRQLILEVGGRVDTEGSSRDAIATGFRLQQALGHHAILRFDGFVAGQDDVELRTGIRTELVWKF